MRRRTVQLFFKRSSLDFVAIGIIGPLSNTLGGNQFVPVMTDRYKTLPRAVPKFKMTTLHIASLFLDKWVIQYGIPEYVLKNIGNIVYKHVFQVTISLFRYTTPKSDGVTPTNERKSWGFNKMIVAQLWHSLTEHQSDWDVNLQLLTCAYNAKVQTLTN